MTRSRPAASRPLAFLLLALLAAAPAATAHAQEFPFTAVVTADGVSLRAGAGQNYYTVGEVAQGTLLQVHDNLYGWYKIEAPEGTYSFIAKEFVKVGADGSTGTVTGQRVRVRAPSPAGPDKSYRTQLMLNDGDAVQIVGESGAFYRIKPPADARLFIKKDFVRQATADEIAKAKEPDTPATPDALRPLTPKPPTTPDTPAAPKPDPVTVTVRPGGSAVILGEVYEGGDLDKALTTLAERNTPLVVKADASVPYGDVKKVLDAAKAAKVTDVAVTAVNSKPATPDTPGTPGTPGTPATPDTPEVAVETPGTPDTPDAPMPDPVPATPDTPEVVTPEPQPMPLPGTTPDRPKTAAESAALTELELRYDDLSQQPITDQPLAQLKMEYEKLLAADDLSTRDKTIAKARIDTLTTRQELQSKIKEVAAVRQELADARERDAAIDASRPRSYTAVGRLVASTLYTGQKLPLLHRIVDPLTGLTIAYVRAGGDASFDLSDLIGQYVGVTGPKQYDPALKLHIIDADSIDALAPR